MKPFVVVVHLPESDDLTPGLCYADLQDAVLKSLIPAINQRNKDDSVTYFPSHSKSDSVDIYPRSVKKEQ